MDRYGFVVAVFAATGVSAGIISFATEPLSDGSVAPRASTSVSAPGPAFLELASGTEILFLDEMVAHHIQAIAIANLVHSRKSSHSLNSIANLILATEPDELRTINSWLAGSAIDYRTGTSPNGIATPNELSALRGATGKRFERLAAEALLRNQEASANLTSLSGNTTFVQLAELARVIKFRQEAVVIQLQSLLNVQRNSLP